MNTKIGGARARPSISPAAFAGAVAVLILVVVGMAYYSFRPPDMPRAHEVHTPLADWIRQKAVESKGDINRLSPEDQARLQGPAQGKGAWYLKNYYEQYVRHQR